MRYPKVEELLRSRVVDPAIQGAGQPGYAMCLSFDPATNTASIVTGANGSDQLGDVYHNVPCPVQVGVQSVSPKQGWMCWVQFRDGTTTSPYITNFFNPQYDQFDYEKQTRAVSDTPRFMVGM